MSYISIFLPTHLTHFIIPKSDETKFKDSAKTLGLHSIYFIFDIQ